ncbi:MAG TPA: HipA family kinase, partial [Albitalea sp.]|nr:HipA family kinase [Albitalea sp.]
MRTVAATRYVTPLREGGSLPAVVEADDDGLYVLKFRGAGQGPKALIAELVGGEIARAAGLPVPEIVFVQLDAELARTEPDPEIQDLIRASAGLNLALDYLPGSVTFDPLAEQPDAVLASSVVWHDAFITNLDRTPRNTNMLVWHGKLWLIDHGAALYFQHDWRDYLGRSTSPFAL